MEYVDSKEGKPRGIQVDTKSDVATQKMDSDIDRISRNQLWPYGIGKNLRSAAEVIYLSSANEILLPKKRLLLSSKSSFPPIFEYNLIIF